MSSGVQKFEVAFLVFWIIFIVVLLALAVLRRLTIPKLINATDANTMAILSYVFIGIQGIVFLFLLIALGMDRWSKVSGFDSWFGLTHSHGSGFSNDYKCSGDLSGLDTMVCRTFVAAGAFTLIFGVIAIIDSAILLVLTILLVLNVLPQVTDPVKPYLDILVNIQWITTLAMIITWAVPAHDELSRESNGFGGHLSIDLSSSWYLTLIAFLGSVACALYWGNEKGEPAMSTGPSGAAGMTNTTQQAPATMTTANAPYAPTQPQVAQPYSQSYAQV
jgi:hypothetical protein